MGIEYRYEYHAMLGAASLVGCNSYYLDEMKRPNLLTPHPAPKKKAWQVPANLHSLPVIHQGAPSLTINHHPISPPSVSRKLMPRLPSAAK